MARTHSIEHRILKAAQSLLAESQEDFTMEQMAARTGISRSTIYRYVGNKEMLLKRLAHERGETFERSDTRHRILNSARVVFGQNGLAAATMEQIADQAGVGVATVYRHFGDKESLIRAFVEEMVPRNAVQTLTLHPSDDVAHDLEDIAGIIMSFFSDNRELLRLFYMGNETEKRYFRTLRHGSDTVLSFLTNYFRAQMDAGRLQRVGEPSELALALIGMMLAFAIVGPLHYGTQFGLPERMGRLVVTIFLNDLRGDRG